MNLSPLIMTLRLALYVMILVTICAASLSYAQSSAGAWEQIHGTAVDIAVSDDGSVVAAGQDGIIYRYNHADENWDTVGGAMVRVAIDADGTLWAIDGSGSVHMLTGAAWRDVGSGALDLAIAPDGNVYVTNNLNGLAYYDVKTRQWRALAGTGARLTIDSEGMIWRVAPDGSIARRLDDAWIGVSGQAVDITADTNGRVIIAGADGSLYEWQEANANWAVIPGASNAASVSAGDGQIWYVDNNGQIFARGIEARHRNEKGIEVSKGGGGSTDPNEVPDTSPIEFDLVSTTEKLAELAIGQDGSVYGLTTGGAIRRWSNNEDRFYDFPGTLNQIAVKDNGLPIGIGTEDNLVEHDGEAWRLINLNLDLLDIALYDDDKLLGISNKEQAVKIGDTYTSYRQLAKQGLQIAAQDDGSYWVIDDRNRLFFCNSDDKCTRQTINATDIGIGPGGTVFIVDTASTLRRFNRDDASFPIIEQGNVSRVAVGPNDRPWIIDNNGLVYAANYFEREEINDRKLAIKTQATEEITETGVESIGSTGIQISQTISFNAVTIPTTTNAYGNIGTGMRDITSGIDDIVIASGYDDPCAQGTGRNWIYNPFSKSFAYMDYLNRASILVGVAADEFANFNGEVLGDKPPATVDPQIEAYYGVWHNNCTELELLEYVAEVFQDDSNEANNNYEDAVLFTPLVPGTESDLDVAEDGTIAFVNSIRELKYFDPARAADNTVRTDIDFLRVGIGADENVIWAVSTSNNVYEYIQSSDSFVLRSSISDNKAQDVGVGHDGTVYIVNMSGVLKKWDPVSKSFIKTNKSGVTRVAVDSKGNPVVANFPSSQIVYFGR